MGLRLLLLLGEQSPQRVEEGLFSDIDRRGGATAVREVDRVDALAPEVLGEPVDELPDLARGDDDGAGSDVAGGA